MPPASPTPLWQISIRTQREAEEAISELLRTTTRCPVSSYHDVRTGSVVVSTHSPKLPAPRLVLLRTLRTGIQLIRRCGLKPGNPKIRFQRLPPSDWAEVWKKHFPPFEVGSSLLIRPSWSRRQPRPGQRILTIDPGLSFGTGHHPTTRFCLEQLAACRKPDQSQALLDIGTGSGLLALAAARLGYAPVKAFDHDAQAVRIARDNARRNRLHNRISLSRSDLRNLKVPSTPRFSVVCANLTADLLLSECQRITAQVQPGGSLLLAGILRRELASIRNTYTALGFRAHPSRRQGEWASLRLERDCF